MGHQIRPDDPRYVAGRAAKYETPTAMHMALDVHPRMRRLLGDPKTPLIVTEGVRKADAAVSVLGVPAVALLGVWNWRGTNLDGGTAALADWEYVALKAGSCSSRSTPTSCSNLRCTAPSAASAGS